MKVILLGSNIGKRQEYLDKASDLIERRIGKIVLSSSVYETEPWGFTNTGLFLNKVVCLDSSPEPEILLKSLMQIETDMGRRRTGHQYTSRLIDLDILFYGDRIIESRDLVIPHPKLHLRKFTLVPLNELFQNFVHPKLGKTINELLKACNDPLVVKIYEGKGNQKVSSE